MVHFTSGSVPSLCEPIYNGKSRALMKSSKFEFYEIVTINTRDAISVHLNGRKAAILGMTQEEGEGSWHYAVHIYGEAESWMFPEKELLPTGQMDVRESFYDGSSIQVKVDPEGRGRVIDQTNVDHQNNPSS